MAQNNRPEDAIQATTPMKHNRSGHWLRVAVMCMSGGFIFPHAMTENDEDTTKHHSDKGSKVKTG